MLNVPQHLLFLQVPTDVFQEDSLHDSPRDRSGADQPVALCIILVTFEEDG